MKVLILCDHFGTGGGAGTIALSQARELARENEVEVLTTHLPEGFEAEGFKVSRFDLDYDPKKRNFVGLNHHKAVKILSEYLSKNKPEVCYIHNIHTNWSYACIEELDKAGVKTVMTFHDVVAVTPYVKLCNIKYTKNNGEYKFNYRYSWLRHLRDAKLSFNPFRNKKIRKYVSHASEKIAVSQALADFLKVNGIHVDKVERNKLPRTSQSNRPIGKNIFFGGRLSTSKGALEAVRYLDVLKKDYGLEPELQVVGSEGVVTDKMKKLAKSLGVLEQIKFLGWLEGKEYEKTIGSSGVVIVPSICFDSFPTVILEAMRQARPVVATIFGGSLEMVEEGVSGYLRDPKKTEEFASAIAAILREEVDGEQLGRVGLEKFRSIFSY